MKKQKGEAVLAVLALFAFIVGISSYAAVNNADLTKQLAAAQAAQR